jgi:CheY-like chemotaxis protein
LDIMMPGKSGISFYEHIRRDRESRDIPVIIISGLSENSLDSLLKAAEQSGLSTKPCRFLNKPVDLRQLLTVIQEALA